MPEGDLTPAQEKFFVAHINKGLLGKLRNKKDLGFAAAFRAYADADKAARPLLTNLPMYPKGSVELAEKDAILADYARITTETLAKTSSQKTAIAACEKGKADLGGVIARAKALMDKALDDSAAPDPDRIVLLKQHAALHLNALRDSFDAQAAPILSEITGQTGVAPHLPVVSSFEAGLAALHNRIAAINPMDQTATAAQSSLVTLMAEGDAHLARKQAELTSYDSSPAKALTIEVGQLDAALRADLALARTQAEQMETWGMAEAKDFVAEAQALTDQAAPLFAATVFATNQAADDAKAARRLLQSQTDALNARAAKLIQDRKAAFGQMFRDVEARFATVERAFRDIDDVTFAKGQKAPIDEFLSLTRTAIHDLNGYNPNALVAAKKLVDQAAVIVSAAQKATETNARIKDELARMDAAIDHGRRKGNPLAATFDDYKLELTGLATRWQTMLLSDATRAVAAFRARLVADVERAKAIDLRRDSARKELALAQSDLALFNIAYGKMLKAYGRKVKPYEGQVVRDLATAEDWIETKTTLAFYDTIDAMLARARKNIADLFTGLQSTEGLTDDQIFADALALQQELEDVAKQALLDMDARGLAPDPAAIANARASVDAEIARLSTRNDLLAEDNLLEQQKADEAAQREAYLRDARAYLKTTRDALKTATPGSAFDHYAPDVRAHLDRVEASMKTVEKGAPARAAQSELAFVQKTIEGIAARGPRTDKNKLFEIGTEWADAVKGFEGKCAEIQTAVQKYLTDQQLDTEYSAAVASLSQALSDIQTRLDPAAFVRTANRFRDPDQFKATREEALQKIRYFNDLLLKDPVIQQCVLNPFGVRDFATPLASRLRQIELNVLRAA